MRWDLPEIRRQLELRLRDPAEAGQPRIDLVERPAGFTLEIELGYDQPTCHADATVVPDTLGTLVVLEPAQIPRTGRALGLAMLIIAAAITLRIAWGLLAEHGAVALLLPLAFVGAFGFVLHAIASTSTLNATDAANRLLRKALAAGLVTEAPQEAMSQRAAG